MDSIEQQVTQIAAVTLGEEEDKITRESNLRDDFSATDIEINDFLQQLEHKFAITISSEEAEGLTTIGKVIEHIEDNADTTDLS